jgi:tRNA(Ile)-lysidine synthase
MNLPGKFKAAVKSNHLFSPNDKLLLAVSGGVDSVVLCELCKQAGYDFMIAHCNFQLRDAESERDEQFVRELGKRYGVETHIKKFDTEQYATQKKLSIQEAAREIRYQWFEELINQLTNQPINQTTNDSIHHSPFTTHHSPFTIHLLTAHHADDNTETLLMNFFRGTGLHGLTGIPVSNKYIKRPLLSFSKEEILQFASENKLAYVEDSSNQSSKYTRNFFRNELIPAISKVYPQVKENLVDNISRFKEIEKLYRFSVGELKKKLCKAKGNEIHIPVNLLLKYNNRALVYEIISPYGFNEKQVDEVIRLAGSESGKYLQSPENNYRLIKHRHWFIISPVAPQEADNIIIEEGEKEIIFSLGTLRLEETLKSKTQLSEQEAMLDRKYIQFPLLLRKWKTGDYFYPLGMKKNLPDGRPGKKKINRFLIDNKLSKTAKENTWVIESAQRIIWVVGLRIDERFKVTDKTTGVLLISLSQ